MSIMTAGTNLVRCARFFTHHATLTKMEFVWFVPKIPKDTQWKGFGFNESLTHYLVVYAS